MTTPASRVTDERLAEMIAGLKGVTRGPWHYSRKHEDAPVTGPSFEIGSADRGVAGQMYALTAAHIARCDPDTIRSILTELLALRSLSSEAFPPDDEGELDIVKSSAFQDGYEVGLKSAMPKPSIMDQALAKFRDFDPTADADAKKAWFEAFDRLMTAAGIRSLSDSVSDGSKGVMAEPKNWVRGWYSPQQGTHFYGMLWMGPESAAAPYYMPADGIAYPTPPCLDSGTGGKQPVAYVVDYRKSDGTTDYFVMLGCDGREMSLHMHRIRGRAEYEAAEINHVLTGSPKPGFDDLEVDAPTALGDKP